MNIVHNVLPGHLRKSIHYAYFRIRNLHKENFECPVCSYKGPFMDLFPSTGLRRHAMCPYCKSRERHRLQRLVVDRLLGQVDVSQWKILHVAPEPFLADFLRQRFGLYETADLEREGMDHQVDLQKLPFASQSYDFVFASHVMEHIPNDEKAISEIRRVLKPNGIAILPVPIVAKQTVEYPEPNPNESNHVRAPGFDYFEKYKRFFSRVEEFSSASLPAKYQLFLYEDRSKWPSRECPLRPPMLGEKHIDIVPVCYV